MKKTFYLLVLAIIIVLSGCNKPKITCKIISPKDGAEVSIFEDLVIVVEATDTKSTVTMVTISLNGLPYPGTQTPPYTTTIPALLLTPGKNTITALAVNREGDQAEASITINIVESGEGTEDESPAYVTFTGGRLPVSWKTNTWEVDIAFGYNDDFSLRSSPMQSSHVTTYKTTRAPSYVEFYTTGGTFDLSIDGVKAEPLTSVSASLGWKKWVYAFEEGRHQFRWTSTLSQVWLDEIRFVPAEVPEITTNTTVTNITAVEATLGGNEVTSHGNHPVIMRGICWSTSPNPTISDKKTENGAGTGYFTSKMTELTSNTLYYVRAYATNAVGTAYGNQVTFTTLEGFLPEVTTGNITNITTTSAICGGSVTNDGNSHVIVRGVCWSTFENPTIDAHKTEDGAGIGSFTSQITGLTHSTRYYVRAYATNNEGTAYGIQESFITAAPLFTAGDYTISLYDSYGDGWHGNNFVSVKVGDTYVLNNITLPNGYGPYHASFYVGENQSVTIYFTSGSYPGECYYRIRPGTTGTGTVIYTSPKPPLSVITW